MKERIQEALRRRHRKGDEGFTLIELLVVILIIAILAAVGIVALLSALNAGKKSSAQTSLRNAITSVKSAQSGAGQTDYEGIGSGTTIDMNNEDPDLTWVAGGVDDTANNISIVPGGTDNILFLATKSDADICYFARLDSNGPTFYSSGSAGGADCDAANGPTADNGDATGAPNTKVGWSFSN